MLRFNCLPTSTSRDSSTRLRSVKDSVHLLQDHLENKSVYLRILHEALTVQQILKTYCPKHTALGVGIRQQRWPSSNFTLIGFALLWGDTTLYAWCWQELWKRVGLGARDIFYAMTNRFFWGQKRSLDSLEMELWMVVSHYENTGNWIQVLWKTDKALTIEPSLQSHYFM